MVEPLAPEPRQAATRIEPARPAAATQPASSLPPGTQWPTASVTAARRDDVLGAVLARHVLQRYKRPGTDTGSAAKRPRVQAMNHRLAPFQDALAAGSRPTWISAVVKPTAVPARGKTPIAKACEVGGSIAGFDGGHIIGLHLGGQNASINVVPMYPRFNRGPWKQLEDHIKLLAEASIEELEMTVTLSYEGPDPRVPSKFEVLVEDPDSVVLDETLKQPDDIPGIAALPVGYAAIIGDARSYQRPALEPTAGRFLLPGGVTYDQVAAAGHLPRSARALYPDKPTDRPYGNLDVLALNGALVVPGQGTMESNRDFSAAQREVILALNAAWHNGQLVSDDPQDPYPNLSPQGTVNAPEIDHIVPKVLGGSNFYSNARVVSWHLNNRAARVKPLSDLVDVSRLAVPTISGNYGGDEKAAKKEARTIVAQWIARNPPPQQQQQRSVSAADLKHWILMLWPTLGPELPERLWARVHDEMLNSGITVTTGPAVLPQRRQVRAKRGQARHRLDL